MCVSCTREDSLAQSPTGDAPEHAIPKCKVCFGRYQQQHPGEEVPDKVWRSHMTRDGNGITLCPNLRKRHCTNPNCWWFQTEAGDYGHSQQYCPFPFPHESEEQFHRRIHNKVLPRMDLATMDAQMAKEEEKFLFRTVFPASKSDNLEELQRIRVGAPIAQFSHTKYKNTLSLEN